MKAKTATMISLAKEDYHQKEINIEKRLAEAENLKNQASKIQKQYDRAIAWKAKKLTEQTRGACQREYKQKINAVYGLTTSALIYSVFVTVLTGINSARFSRDLADAFQYGITILKLPFAIAVKSSKSVYRIKNMIQHANISIIAVLLTALTFVSVAAVGYGLMYLIARRSVQFYHEKVQDIVSMTVALVSMAPLVQFADRITWLRINLILVWVIINALYFLLRLIIHHNNKNAEIWDI